MKTAYIVCSAIQSTVLVGGGAWLTYSGGNGWWLAGALALVVLSGVSFTQRMNEWTK